MNTTDLACTLTVREDAPTDGVAAVLEGVAVPYGTEIDLGGVREQFAPGAFDPIDVIGKPLFWRHGEHIGRVTHAQNRDDALVVTATIADTVQGRDAATLARLGGMGLSVGFTPVQDDTKTRGLITRLKAQLRELSLTPTPAYATAGVAAIREDNTVSEQTIEETPVVSAPEPAYARSEDLAALQRQIASMTHVTGADPVHPLAEFRSLGEYAKAVYEGRVESRTIVDQITTDNPGVLPPAWIQDVKGIVNLGRPGISALGVQSAGASGMSVDWPYFDGDINALVGAQATEKTDITSVKVSLKKGAANLATYAGGSDISYQLIMRSSPSYIDAYLRIMAAAYAAVTDNAFVDALVTGGTASAVDYDLAADTDGTKFRSAIFVASTEVESATGSPASAVLVASDVWAKIGGWSTFVPGVYGTQNVSGTAQASTLAVNVSGLPVVHDRNLAAGSILVANGAAASFIEDGPHVANAEVPTKLGRDVAIFGFGATAIFVPKGVVKVTNLP